jgi:hypothetical protein
MWYYEMHLSFSIAFLGLSSETTISLGHLVEIKGSKLLFLKHVDFSMAGPCRSLELRDRRVQRQAQVRPTVRAVDEVLELVRSPWEFPMVPSCSFVSPKCWPWLRLRPV